MNTNLLLGMVLIATLTTGCATGRGIRPMTSQQTDVLKIQLGTIGVAGARYVPKVAIKTPAKGAAKGAIGGMASGAVAPFAMPKNCRGNVGCYVLLGVFATALVPAGVVVGGVGGTITADTAENVNAREATLTKALTDLKMQETFRDRVQAKIADLNTFPVELVADKGPDIEGHNPDYRPLKAAGIDTVHEVEISRLRLTGSGRVSPNLAIRLYSSVRHISTADNNVLFSRKYECGSKQDKFATWAADNAKKFNEEINRCYDDLSNRMVHDIYINNTLLNKEINI